MIGRVVPVAANPWTVRSKSDAPTPQFAPNATGGWSNFSTIAAIAFEVMPIIVRPAVSKLMVPHHGIPASFAASAAAAYSSGAEIVSTHKTSAPPSFRPSACSWNISTASAWVRGPRGAMISPVGPIEPATITVRPEASAMSRPISAAMRDSSRARWPASCNLSRARLPPNELVKKISEPASTAPR